MKITALTTWRVAPRWMFLKVETDEGTAGWGEPVLEGRARTVEAAVRELGETLVGKDPLRINDHWQAMYRSHFYRGGAIPTKNGSRTQAATHRTGTTRCGGMPTAASRSGRASVRSIAFGVAALAAR